jgi:hypothetical protein
MTLTLTVVAVVLLVAIWRLCAIWAEDNRQAAIRQEMAKDHAREEWLKKLATMQRQERL